MGLLDQIRSGLQGASNSAAGNISAPVDALAWILRKGGLPIPKNPVGGSDWMAEQGLTATPQNRLAGLLGETAGMLAPFAPAKKIAGGLLSLDDKAMDMARRGVENYMDSTGMKLNMFAGEKALKADKVALLKAQQMASSGSSQKSIWDATGWLKGKDGQWRFEIDDSAARLMPADRKAAEWMAGPGPAEYPVGGVSNIIKHEALFENYPDLAGIRTRLKNGDSGSYIPNNNGFGEALNLPAIFRNGDYTTPDRTTSNALHELQHAIQKREGFALGGTGDTIGYKQLPGEIEARLVEARRLMTPEQRAKAPPFGRRNGVPTK